MKTTIVRDKIVKTEKNITNLLTDTNLNFKNIIFNESERKIYFDIDDDTFVLEIHLKRKKA